MNKSRKGGAAKKPVPQKKKKNAPKNKAATIANTLLNKVLSKGAAGAGLMATRAISRIVGVGDYTVKSNSIEQSGGALSGEVPHFGKENNSTRIRHREFIADITIPANAAAFNNTSYVINPSNKDLFPWLANLAESWQQYRVHGMVFYFKTTTSDYAANGAMGKVAMATNYNVRDQAYANMQELENAEFSVSGKPSLSRMHPIECASNNGLPLVRYVRDAQYDASGGDDRLYDIGKFQFATQGLPGSAGQVLGELWVTYDIEFYKPIVGRDVPAVQYEPVLVPQFNNLAGNNTKPDFMIERSYGTVSSSFPPTRDNIWELLHRPDKFFRIAPTEVDSALICRSPFRPEPDPDPTSFTYPAYWDAVPGAPAKSELRLTRPGIWFMHFRADVLRNETTAAFDPPATCWGVATPTPNLLSEYFVPGIEVSSHNADGTRNVYDEVYPLSHGVNQYTTPPTKNDIQTVGPTGFAHRKFLYRNGADWSLILWVTEDQVADSKYVAVRFQTHGETATSPGTYKLKWDGNELFNPLMFLRAQFEIGVVTVKEQTYYRPVNQGLTTDDKSQLEASMASILALVPKLRELGFSVDV